MDKKKALKKLEQTESERLEKVIGDILKMDCSEKDRKHFLKTLKDISPDRGGKGLEADPLIVPYIVTGTGLGKKISSKVSNKLKKLLKNEKGVMKIGGLGEDERKLLKLLEKSKKVPKPKTVKELEPMYNGQSKRLVPKPSNSITEIQKSVEKASKKKMTPEEKIISRQAISRESFKDKITNIDQAKEYGETCSLKKYQALKRESKEVLKRKDLYKLKHDKPHMEELRKRGLLYREAMKAYELAHPRLPKDIGFWKMDK